MFTQIRTEVVNAKHQMWYLAAQALPQMPISIFLS